MNTTPKADELSAEIKALEQDIQDEKAKYYAALEPLNERKSQVLDLLGLELHGFKKGSLIEIRNTRTSYGSRQQPTQTVYVEWWQDPKCWSGISFKGRIIRKTDGKAGELRSFYGEYEVRVLELEATRPELA